MPKNDPAPEADTLEQSRPVDDAELPPEGSTIPPDVPEADALEQARPLADNAPDEVRLGADVPEADALEQAVPVSDDDEYE
ncbi:MAG TPA: hypothetical protein VI854_07765 [Acidimicrobiia bacterium]|nr:hypothetical protein [Acidimicrobiia bacterium]